MKNNIKTDRKKKESLSLVSLASICFVVIIAAVAAIMLIQNKLNNENEIVLGHLAENENEIIFNDANMYNKVRNAIDSTKIVSYDDSTRTIVMTSEDIASITELNLGNTDGFYADEYNENYVSSANKTISDDEKIVDISGIEKFTNLRKLYLYNNKISDISKLRSLTNLRDLRLEGNEISNLEYLSGLTNLKYLHLDYNPITNVDDLQDLTSMVYLSIYNCKVTNIDKLNKLTNLSILKIANNDISDIGVVSNFSNLTQLSAGRNDTKTYTAKINSIEAIKNLDKLVRLLVKSGSISDISCLREGHDNIEFLELDGNEIVDISPISSITNLKHLNLQKNQISDIGSLSSLENLEWLSLSYNPINNGDITILSNLSKLKQVGLNNCGITNISPLKNLTSIVNVNLQSNNITDITPLAKLKDLGSLNLSNNSDLVNINTLKNLTKITWLSLSNCSIESIDSLSTMSDLSEVGFGNNKIVNIDSIKDKKLKSLNARSNLSEDTVSTKTYKLPSIFTEVQNSDCTIAPDLYTKNSLILTNCTLSDDGQSIILRDRLKLGEKVIVKVPNGTVASSTTLTLTPTDEYVKVPTPKITYSRNDTGKVIAKVTFDKDDVTITNNDGKNTYLIDSTEKFAFEYKDTNGTTGSAKIDDISPKIASVSLNSVTQNSLILNIKGKDNESGTSKINVYVNDKLAKEYTYTSDYNEEKTETFTMSDLMANTKYTYYIEVIDQVGNISTTEKAEVITSKLPELDIKFFETPTEWTKSDAKVELEILSKLPSSEAKLQYKIESLDGKVISNYNDYTKDGITVDRNCIVKARYLDGKNTSNEKVYEVKNIDKDLPIVENIEEVEITENSFKINIKALDELSGLSKVRLYVDNKLVSEYNTTDTKTTELTGKVTGLVAGTKYTYYIEVEDKVGNITSTKSETKEITTLAVNQENNGEVNIYNNNNNGNNVVNTSDKIIYYVVIAVVLVILVNIAVILIVKSKNKSKKQN